MATKEMAATLREYRAAIREAWLPLVKRKKLSSFEYRMIEEWHRQDVPVEWILRAIKQCAGRVQTLFSLGIVKGDLAGIERQQSRMTVGSGQKAVGSGEAWRAKMVEDLLAVGEMLDAQDPERGAMYLELARDLPRLSEDEALKRWRDIARDRGGFFSFSLRPEDYTEG